MLHGYCIRLASHPGPDDGLNGVDGRPVRRVDAAGLQVWVSDGTAEPVTLDRLREHERVVRAALRTATPLPLRFGSRFASDADAAAALVDRQDDFRDSLEQVRDRVEMSVRVALATPPERPATAPTPPDEGAAASPGRRYLERRREALESEAAALEGADRILAGLEQDLDDLALPTVRTTLPHGESVGSLAHLVHRSALRPYRQRIHELRRRRSDLRIALSGPWAPYSFV